MAARDKARDKTRNKIGLAVGVVLLVAAAGGTVFAVMTSSGSSVETALPTIKARTSGQRATGPAGGPAQEQSGALVPAPSSTRRVACTYTTADAGQDATRIADKPAPVATESGRIRAVLKTNLGDITADLLADPAPCTVHSFASLVAEDYYTDTSCHRITTAGLYVLQCGDPSGTGTGSPGYEFAEENLPKAGTSPAYPKGTLAMANAGPGTTGAQFFVVYQDSDIPPAYSVFGTITSGIDIVQRVAANGTVDGSTDGKPKVQITISGISLG
jgi:peptidyl-prolyl cis-trans isomerase B (cyclophilin B)